MFVIKYNNIYFHNKKRIILFDSMNEVNMFMELFKEYAMYTLAQSGAGIEIMQVPMILSQCNVIEPDFDINKLKNGTVYARELLERIVR